MARNRQTKKIVNVLLGDNPHVPVPIESIVQSRGIRLMPYDLGPDISGVLIIENGTATIGYNPDHSEVRTRFTIAHELGHYELHKGRDLFVDKDYKVMYRGNGLTSGNRLEEAEANDFAASILMPETLVRAELEQNRVDYTDDNTIKELANKFCVSSIAMSLRISNLDL